MTHNNSMTVPKGILFQLASREGGGGSLLSLPERSSLSDEGGRGPDPSTQEITATAPETGKLDPPLEPPHMPPESILPPGPSEAKDGKGRIQKFCLPCRAPTPTGL